MNFLLAALLQKEEISMLALFNWMNKKLSAALTLRKPSHGEEQRADTPRRSADGALHENGLSGAYACPTPTDPDPLPLNSLSFSL